MQKYEIVFYFYHKERLVIHKTFDEGELEGFQIEIQNVLDDNMCFIVECERSGHTHLIPYKLLRKTTLTFKKI